MNIFVTGIGTGVGKTVVSAIITEALKADYWKPVQAGDLDRSDTKAVQSLVSNSKSKFHPEAYRFKTAMSPHAAAGLENTIIDMGSIQLPATDNHLVIEGAGGVLVPLTNDQLMIDLIEKLRAPVVVVSKNYLGSINHTLLTVEVLKSRNISIMGIVFNGEPNIETENFILDYTGLPCLGTVLDEEELNREIIEEYAEQFLEDLE